MRQPKATNELAFDIDPERSIGYLIRDASRNILAKLTVLLEPHGITLAQYFVLRELWRNEGLTQRELGDRIGTQESTTVSTLDAMEARKLLTRVRSTSDRRKTNIYLTPYGRSLRSELLGYAASIVNDATADFGPRNVAKLRALLIRLNANLRG